LTTQPRRGDIIKDIKIIKTQPRRGDIIKDIRIIDNPTPKG